MSLDLVLKIAPVVCGIISIMALGFLNYRKKKENNLQDFFVIGTSGSSIPTGILLIYSGFDFSVLSKINDGGVYMAFSGLVLLYIFYKTFKEKA